MADTNKDQFAAYTGTQIDVVGKAVAIAIAQSRKFGADQHKVAMDYIIKNSAPASLSANLARIGNVSAVRQELEKAGLVNGGALSALATEVGKAIDEMAKAAKK